MEFRVFDLGLIDYQKAWQIQKDIFTQVKTGLFRQAMILCQHYPVITLGRLANKRNILIPEYELRKRKIPLYNLERGGDVTYHGPGQLMVYPIFNLSYLKKDIYLFLRQLEEIVISLLSDFEIKAGRYSGLTGVWIDRKKIASIGIAIKRWITFHGLSINIKKTDLDNFRFIRPCGMQIEMTSIETILGSDIEIDDIKEKVVYKFRGWESCLSSLNRDRCTTSIIR